MSNNSASWQTTKQTKRQSRSDGAKSVGSGCLGCFGMLCVMGSALYFFVQTIAATLSRSVDHINNILGEVAAGEDAADALENVFGTYAVAAAVIMLAGFVIVLLPEFIKGIKWSNTTKQIGANSVSEWDSAMVENRDYAASSNKVVILGLLLLGIPMLVYPVAAFLPVGPIISLFVITADVVCFIGGIIAVITGGLKSFLSLSQLGSKADFKSQFVLTELELAFTDVIYKPAEGIDYSLIASAGLIDDSNLNRGNDYIRARYKGVPFEQSDISLKKESVTKPRRGTTRARKTRIRLLFQGRWLILEIKKSIQGEFYIFNRQFPVSGQLKKRRGLLEDTATQDPVFDSVFSILATNPHDVFYMLTPIVLDKFKALFGLNGDGPNQNGIGIYCKDNKMHIAVSGVKDAFEPIIVETGNEQIIRGRIRAQISLIRDIIDALE